VGSAKTKSDFFNDISVAIESWQKAGTEALTNPNTDLMWANNPDLYRKMQLQFMEAGIDSRDVEMVLGECLRGFANSMLTLIDGGTALAEQGRIYLVDEKGRKLGEGLHDDFASFLLERAGKAEL
jgi:hypothetical protein